MGGAESLQAAMAARGGYSSVVGHSGADLEQAILLKRAETTVGAGKDGPRLEQLAADDDALENLAITSTSPSTAVHSGGATITVTGTGFTDTKYVILEGSSNVVIVIGSLTVTATTVAFALPAALTAAAVKVTIVTTTGYVSQAAAFTVT